MKWLRPADVRSAGHTAEILGGSLLSLALRVFAVALTFVFNVLVARRFGAEGAGLYGLAITVITMSMTLALFGLDHASVKFVAAAQSVRAFWRVERLSVNAVLIVLALSTASAVAVYFSRTTLASEVFSEPGLKNLLAIMSIAIVPLALARLAAACLRAVKRLFAALMAESVLVPLMGTLILLAATDQTIEIAGIAHVSASIAAAIFGLSLWWRFVRRHHMPSPADNNERLAGDLARAGVPMMGIALADISSRWIVIYMIGILGEASDVGIFRVSLQIATLLGFLVIANNSIVAPKIAALYGAGNVAAIGQIWRFSVGLILALGIPASVLFMVFPTFLLSLFGPEFAAAQTTLQILVLGQLVNLATGPVGMILIMTGRERVSLANSAASALVVLVLSFMLLPNYGVDGAAAALAIGLGLRNIIAAYLVWRLVVAGIVVRGAT